MFPQLGVMEMVIVMGVAVLLFGKRLPEVGRSLGKGIIEFKKGLRGIEDGFDFGGTSSSSSSSSSYHTEDRPKPTPIASSEGAVPKFEPPTPTDVPQMEYHPQAVPQD